MSIQAAILAMQTPTPTPTPLLDETMVTPGPIGFLAWALVALATVVLVLDMTRRIRRTRYRGELRERLAAEQAEKPAPADGRADEAPEQNEARR